MANKNAATESMVAKLHSQITKIFGMSLAQMIRKLEDGDDAEFAVDTKLLGQVITFLDKNAIYAVPEEEAAGSPLQKQIEEIKARQRATVVPLVREA